MNRPRLSVRRLMEAVAAIAVCYAFMMPLVASGFALAILVIAFWPGRIDSRRLVLAATAGWLLAAIVAFSEPFVDLIALALLFLSGGAIAVWWTVRSFISPRPWRTRRDLALWLAVPAAGLLGLGLLITDWDFRLRLRLSEPALIAQAESVFQGELRPGRGNRVGLFWPRWVHERDGCVTWTTGTAFFDSFGFLYAPNDPPPKWSEHRFDHIRGPWWRFNHYD